MASMLSTSLPRYQIVESKLAFANLLAQVAPLAQVKVTRKATVANTDHAASQASTRSCSPSGSSSAMSSSTNSPRLRAGVPTKLQRRCNAGTLEDLGTDAECDKPDIMSVCGSSPTQDASVASISPCSSTPLCTPTSVGIIMCTQPGTHVQPTIAIVTGDASRRSPAGTPMFDKPVQKGITHDSSPPGWCPREPVLNEGRLQQCAIQSSIVGVGGRDCSIMRTSPTQTRGMGVKTSFIDASLRTRVGTVVSTKPPTPPPSSLSRSPLNAKLDASHRNPATSTGASTSEIRCCMEPTQDASRQSPNSIMVTSPPETHCGTKPTQDASSQSPISSTLETPLATCCGTKPTQGTSFQSPISSTGTNPSKTRCDKDALTSWLVGVNGPLPNGEELAEKLRAVAPEMYED